MVTNLLTAFFLIIYLALAWFAGTLVGASGARLWILRTGLWVIGCAAAGLFLWFNRKLKRDRLMSGSNAQFFSELDALLTHADARLKQKNGSSLSSLSIVYVIGESNTAKTSILQHCGLQPELIAGEPERDAQIAATATINVWQARNTLLIEAGGKLANDASLWTYLLERTQPNLLSASLGKQQQPWRAIVVCFDCERLAAAPDPITASAHKLSARLREAAATLGSSLPVYVLFTKADRVTHFAEFVGNLSQQETSQALGATLTRAQIGDALMTEDEEQKTTTAFDQLVYSLADKRVEYLERETSVDKLPSIYEFPRELRKLRQPIVQFLVELLRPTPSSTACFLRGFYFSGVRAVVISETVTPPKVTAAAAASVAAATRMFNMEDLNALSETPSGPVVQSRKVPEWSFLPQLFQEVILRDNSALDVSRYSRKVDQARAALVGFAAAFLLLAAALFAVSFVKNRAMEQDILGSARVLQSVPEPSPGQLASLDQLRGLDHLRGSLLQLGDYEANGRPLSERFGLYEGERIYPDARQIYFENFRKLILHPVQVLILQQLSQLPAAATPTNEFGGPYKSLKTYLITTSNSDKGTPDFLVPALLERWTAGQDVDDERQALARKQFEYYAAQLATSNPLPSDVDTASVEHARQYLRQFNGVERIYQSMLADAARKNPDVDFNRQYSGSAQVVSDSHVIPGAYTRGGFILMQDALKNPDKYYGAEEWVLGQASAVNIPKEKLQEDLRNRYAAEYLNHWRTFLRSANVVHYGSANDAANKLRILSGNRSPLMQLFWVAANNTNVDLPGSAKAFDAVQRVANGATEDHPIGPGEQLYMSALNSLQGALSAVAAAPEGLTDSGPMNSALVAAGNARSSVGQIAQGFLIDSEGHMDSQVRKLMEDPVVSAESLVRRLVQQQAQKQSAEKQSAQKQ